MIRRLLAVLIVTMMVVAVLPAGAWAQAKSQTTAGANTTPQTIDLPNPTLLWIQPLKGMITDMAVGDLNDDGNADVAIVDGLQYDTLRIYQGQGNGALAGLPLWSKGIYGYATAVGDIDGDDANEVVVDNLGTSIVAFEDNGTVKWVYPKDGIVNDIKLGDVDGDGKNDLVACSTGSYPGTVLAVDGETGVAIPGWPVTRDSVEFLSVAVGQLDGVGGMDVAAFGMGGATLYAFHSWGEEMWVQPVDGRKVEIGDVNGDGLNEVVAGGVLNLGDENLGMPNDSILVYSNLGAPLYHFLSDGIITDIELGDLDGDPANGVEVACIDDTQNSTLYALDINQAAGSQTMWTYPMSRQPALFGQSLKIGDVDRDYQNEVIACGNESLIVFDGLDHTSDGLGDLVWAPFNIPPNITFYDVEIGDLDGDGDQDVVFAMSAQAPNTPDNLGEDGQRSVVVAFTGPETNTWTATGTGTAYFDSDPSQIGNLQAVAEGTLPSTGKPLFTYPNGFFSFEITGLILNQVCTVTVTLPQNAPLGTKWVKCENGVWSVLNIGDDDGDNVITYQIKDGGIGDADGTANGTIIEPGGPGFPLRRGGVGGEVNKVDRLTILAPWLLLSLALSAGAVVFILRRRKAG